MWPRTLLNGPAIVPRWPESNNCIEPMIMRPRKKGARRKADQTQHQEESRSTWATRSFPPAAHLDLAAGMDRWTGVVNVPLSRDGPLFHVAASLILSPAKTLAVRLANHPDFPLSPSLRLQSLNSLMAAGSARQRYPVHGRPRPRDR
jgi:hypothetical protein